MLPYAVELFYNVMKVSL